jgi:hypothetical protein
MNDFERALTFSLYRLQRSLCAVARVMERGRRKHPDDDGYSQTSAFHIERARRHLEALAASDRDEDHLEHAAARLLMAVEAKLR